uniref:G-protein coupled receptors family 1 profile domain-containing protein n=1 Tax=Meleagris gallopavo TaxID=9103 RepID=G1N5E0_MELGA
MSSNSSQAPPSRTPGPFDGPQWPYQAPRSTYVGVAVLMGTVVACASVVNGLVIVVSIRYKKLRSPLNYILVNLAVADLLVTLCGSSISLSNNINGFFVFGRKMCELEGFMVSLTGIVGLWSLAILALERYVVVCRPLGDLRFQRRHAVSGCAFTWGWALLWSVPPLLGWSSYVTSCGPNWYTGGSNNNSYILSLFVTCFVLPLSLILFSYANLLVTLRAVRAAVQARTLAGGAGPELQSCRVVLGHALPWAGLGCAAPSFLVFLLNPVIAVEGVRGFLKAPTWVKPNQLWPNAPFLLCSHQLLC